VNVFSRSPIPVAFLVAWLGCGGLAPVDLSGAGFLPAGALVTGPSGAYTLTPARAFWKHAPPGSLSQGGADLELVGGDDAGAAWVVVFVGLRPEATLERTVRSRREHVLSQWGLASFEEERGFWPDAALVPAAHGRYVSRAEGGAPPELLATLALETRHAVIEVVGHARRGTPYETELEALLASFALAGLEASAAATGVWSNSVDFAAAEIVARAEVELRCDGTLHERLVREIAGPPGDALRARLAPLTEEEQARWLRDEFAAAVGDEVRPRFWLGGLESPGEPVVIHSEALYPTRGPVEGRREIHEPDSWLVHYGSALASAPVRGAISIESETRYVLCPSIAAPFAGPALAFRAPAGSLLREYALGEGEARVATRLGLHPAPDAAAIAARGPFLERVLPHTNVWLRLVPRP
jgi:hypothetical protein